MKKKKFAFTGCWFITQCGKGQESRCFEDLELEDQMFILNKFIEKGDFDALRTMCILLADNLYALQDHLQVNN